MTSAKARSAWCFDLIREQDSKHEASLDGTPKKSDKLLAARLDQEVEASEEM